jgi:hypothetical protein
MATHDEAPPPRTGRGHNGVSSADEFVRRSSNTDRNQQNHLDFGNYMKAVALALLGEPNRRLSKGANLRFGSNGSLSVNLEKGAFYSHEEKKGGGVLDLIKAMKGLDAPAAIEWMRSQGLSIDDDRHGPSKRSSQRQDVEHSISTQVALSPWRGISSVTGPRHWRAPSPRIVGGAG